MACLAAKPVVDGLEQRMGDKLEVARLDVSNKAGREIASRYRIDRVPAFVLLDAKGSVLYRKLGGSPDSDEIAAMVEAAARD